MTTVWECRDCGSITRERTPGLPDGSCPARAHVDATHRYEAAR